MAGETEFTLTGLDTALGKMAAVSQTVKSKAARSALRKAGMIIVKAARQTIDQHADPETPQDIGKNIAIQWNSKRFRATGDIAFRIGVRGGAVSKANPDVFKVGGSRNNPGGDTWYWRLLEFGTKSFIAKPFLRPAMANNIQPVTDSFTAELGKALDKAARTGKAQ